MIDPFRFAKRGQQLEKVVTLLPKGRLDGIIADKSDVSLQLTGGKYEKNRFVLEGHLGGTATVQCQVCLENLALPLDIDFSVVPVTSEERAEQLQQEYEPIVIEDNSLALSELVTNELILSMPVACTHIEINGEECIEKDSLSTDTVIDSGQEEKKSSPFAILKSIKQQKS